MQYYRLWIYSCNVVLGLTSTIFIIFAAFVVADVRLTLLEGVELYHPTFFYAYGALILQCGVVQTIGCLGAKRLSHKLLSLYWTLLLLLTLGDIGVGLYWVFHLEKVKINLRPYLNKEFIEKYSTDETFTLRWNKIQSQDRCCGVDGPFDFDKFPSPKHHHSKQAAYSTNVIVDVETGILSLPESCCTYLHVPTAVSSSSSGGPGIDKTYRVPHYSPEEEHPPFHDQSSDPAVHSNGDHHHHSTNFDGGGGRHGRTVINLPHKNDEPRSHAPNEGDDKYDDSKYVYDDYDDDDDDEDDDDEEAEEHDDDFNNYSQLQQARQQTPPHLVVPDDHNHGMQLSDSHRPDFGVPKRDITTYEPTHTHKLRHELHRKSQTHTAIDAKPRSNSSLFSDKGNSATERIWNGLLTSDSGRSGSSRSSVHKSRSRDVKSDSKRRHNNNNNNNSSSSRISDVRQSIIRKLLEAKKDDNEYVVPQPVLYYNQNHNKTNKLFPSISFHARRRRRETRALSVTQVPVVSAPIQTRIVCRGQPEGLNHHNSFRESLLDQKRTTKSRQKEVKEMALLSTTSESKNAKKSGKARIRKKRTSRASSASGPKASSTAAVVSPNTAAELQPPDSEAVSAVIVEKVGANKNVKKSTKKSTGESLLAMRKSEKRIMTDSGDASLHSSKLTSLSSFGEKKAQAGEERRPRHRQKRNVQQMKVDDTDSNLQADTIDSAQNSAFTSNSYDEAAGERETETSKKSDTFARPYFYSLSSSSAVSSSTSYLEANSPQAAIVSPSTSPFDQWNENNENGATSANNNNASGSAPNFQKRLYVYGVGCGVKLIEWVDHVSGIMFILGFCIIGFAKTWFLVILRTEIREMIEKINMIEPEEVMSPSRPKEPRFHHVSHPLLQNPHRASTVSAHGIALPTIKSPDLPTASYAAPPALVGAYNRPSRHYLRRASNIVGGDRSRSHSNETVNMTMLMAASHSDCGAREKPRSNPNLSSGGGSCGTIANLEERDAVSGLSATIPHSSMTTTGSTVTGAARYLRRSSTCATSTNPAGYPFSYGFDGEPRAGPSSRFYHYFEPLYQPPHLYQQHHHHHYMRNRPHARNMSCGAILPLAAYRSNSCAAAASAAIATFRGGGRNLSGVTAAPSAASGAGFSSTSRDENEMIISVSLEHIASSDQDEDIVPPVVEEEDEREQENKDWAAAAACLGASDNVKSASKVDDTYVGTKLQTFTLTEIPGENSSAGSSSSSSGDRELQRRNGNNNVDLANSLPISYIGTPV